MADSVQEMSFQNVVETILKPQGIKVGGYPDDLFIDLAEKDRERWQCNICYLVLRDPRQCDNKHKFCNTCVFAWSMTYGANSDKCPVCRSKQHEYNKDVKLAAEISFKWIKCPETGCALRCSLSDFLQHSHGIKLYANSNADAMDNVRQTRRPPPVGALSGGAEIMFLPTLSRNPMAGQGGVREGRNLLQDMLLVLHLEMELRRRAIDRFSSAAAGGNVIANQIERDRHMTEVLAIQEQMQEITGFLNILFSIPPQHSRHIGGMATFPGTTHHEDSSDDSDDSDSSSSAVDSQYRLSDRNRQRHPNSNSVVTGNGNTNGSGASNVTVTSLPRSHAREPRQAEPAPNLRNNEATRPRNSGSSTNTTLARPRTGTSRIDINNNPLSNTSNNNLHSSTNNQSSADDTQIANSIRRGAVERHETRQDTSRDASTVTSETSQVDLQETYMMPRASSTFQSALEQLPPISTHSTAHNDIPPTEPSQPANNMRPGVTPAPHRRPAPPAGQGRSINTARLRRRTNSSNNQALPSTNGPSQSSTQQTSTTTSNGQASRRASNNTQAQSNQQNRSGLPATSGALLRARRRSEIQQQIHQDLSNDDNS